MLYGAAWPLVRRALLLRIEAADRRFGDRGLLRKSGQLVIPYYVPLFDEVRVRVRVRVSLTLTLTPDPNP